jgi:hypothetical protein
MSLVEDGPDGPHWATKSGTNMGLVGGVGSVGGKLSRGRITVRFDRIGAKLVEDMAVLPERAGCRGRFGAG